MVHNAANGRKPVITRGFINIFPQTTTLSCNRHVVRVNGDAIHLVDINNDATLCRGGAICAVSTAKENLFDVMLASKPDRSGDLIWC